MPADPAECQPHEQKKMAPQLFDRSNRRKFKRLKVREGAFAVLSPQSASSKIGNIIDISRGGLAFYYVDSKENAETIQADKMNIFVSGEGFQLEEIQFKVVSEIVMPKKIPFYAVVTRRFGVAFDKISSRATSQIENFIRHHAMEEFVPDTPA